MWQLKTLTIQNPAGLSIEPTVNWLGETHLFGPQREVLFTALTQQLLRPQCSVTLGFNPRAQMFRSLQNILSLAESVLSLTNGHPSEKRIGAIVANEKDNLKHELQSSSIQKMLRAEIILFLACVSVNSSLLSESDALRVFEYLSSVNSQTDEMLPSMVEQALGREARSVFELLTSQIFFYRSSRIQDVQHKIYEAEHTLSRYIATMHLPSWKSDQVAPATVVHDGSSKDKNAVFIPYSSSSKDVETSDSTTKVCSFLLKNGVTQFYVIDSFVERLRWIERIAVRRQLERLEAVRGEPLRAQAFFDARAGRNSFILLSDQVQSILQHTVSQLGLVHFEMEIQEMISTSLEIFEMRKSTAFFKDPMFDLIVFADALDEASRNNTSPRSGINADVIRQIFQLGAFP